MGHRADLTRQQDVATVAQDIDRDLRAIREILRRPLDLEIAKGDLTGPQQSAMAVLVRSKELTLKDLTRQLGLAHSTTSGIVDRLAKRGLVERRQDSADGRTSRIVVTRRVRQYMEDTLPELLLHPLAEALQQASPAERQSIRKGLKTLRRVLEGRSTRTKR
jgi:DNA-binding MarR family transcriptional regulator